MKVLIETDAVGGVWTFSLDLARGLLAAGHEAELAVVGCTFPDSRRATVPPGLRIHRCDDPLEWEPGGTPAAGDDPCAAWLAEVAITREAEVVQTCSYRHAAAGQLRDAGVSTVLTAHSDVVTWWHAVLDADPPAEYDAYRRNVAAALASADQLVTPTAAHAAQLADAFPTLRHRPHPPLVIHNGITGVTVMSRDATRPVDSDHEKRAGVVTLGRLHDPGKNIGVLSAAAAELHGRLTLIGPANDADRAAMPAARWTGELAPADVQRELANALIYAGSSRYEPFGLAPLEAAARGCALVLADIPTFREVWGDAAVYIDSLDPDAWADRLRDMLDHPDATRRAGHLARHRAQRYTAGNMVQRYLALYAAASVNAPQPSGAAA